LYFFFFYQAEDGIRDRNVTGVQTCALPIWRHLDKAFLHVFREAVSAHDLIESVIERPQIGVYLALKVAGKKSQLLSRLDRRPCENDPADFFIAESGHRHSHREVRLTGSRGAYAEHDHFLSDLLHILLLPQRLGLDGASLNGVADHVFVDLGKHLIPLLHGKRKGVGHILSCYGIASLSQSHKFHDKILRKGSALLCSKYFKNAVSGYERDIHRTFNQF